MPFPSSTCSLATHTCVQASSFALAVVFFFLPVIKIQVLTNSVRYDGNLGLYIVLRLCALRRQARPGSILSPR